MAFHEVQFPAQIARDATGGPTFRTAVFLSASGYEQRNIAWAKARGRWQVGHRVKSPAEFAEVLAFFYARAGKAHGFRFKDWLDYRSTQDMQVAVTAFDQAIGTGNGTTTTFQLTKTYTSGSASYVRTIAKPVSGTVRVGKAGVEQTSGWSVDTTTGVVTFTSPLANGQTITAGYDCLFRKVRPFHLCGGDR